MAFATPLLELCAAALGSSRDQRGGCRAAFVQTPPEELSEGTAEIQQRQIEGVTERAAANNAYATGALIPLFTLGIPGSPTVAVIMDASVMKGASVSAGACDSRCDFEAETRKALRIARMVSWIEFQLGGTASAVGLE
jgi:tripartite tricarboxylate transporter TctA family protein